MDASSWLTYVEKLWKLNERESDLGRELEHELQGNLEGETCTLRELCQMIRLAEEAPVGMRQIVSFSA